MAGRVIPRGVSGTRRDDRILREEEYSGAGFGPEAGEKAEPIAMGRQTIWGGAGKPPSRDVMQAAAKAARTEMLQRVREKKVTTGDRGGNGGGGAGRGNGGANGGGGRGGQRSSQPVRAAMPIVWITTQIPTKTNVNISLVNIEESSRFGLR